MRISLPFALVLFSSLAAQACKYRAVWFWQEDGHPYGASNIVGNAVLENQTVSFLTSRWVRRVYGSYGQQPVTSPTISANWNAKLDAAGIQSQLLMSDNTWIFPTNHSSLLTKITQRVLNFNNAPGRTVPQKFDGLHLDIEPHALTNWSALTAADKRQWLFLLRDTYAVVRQHLASNGVPTFPVYADLPVWFDKLPADAGQIGWTNAADRNQWFSDIATNLTGITFMAFDQTALSAISNGVAWERANIAGTDVRVGLESDIGATNTWATLADFNAMMETVEAAFGFADAVDIQDYTSWRQAWATLPILPVAVAYAVRSQAAAADISFETEANWTYVVNYSMDLCGWQEVQRIPVSAPGKATIPVRFDNVQGFWSITRFATPVP